MHPPLTFLCARPLARSPARRFSIVYTTLIVFWTRPAFLRPGGFLEALMFSRIKEQTSKESDTILCVHTRGARGQTIQPTN